MRELIIGLSLALKRCRFERANSRSEEVKANVMELILVLILFKGANPRS